MYKNYSHIIFFLAIGLLGLKHANASIGAKPKRIASKILATNTTINPTEKDSTKQSRKANSLITTNQQQLASNNLLKHWQKTTAQAKASPILATNQKYRSFPQLEAQTQTLAPYDIWDNLSEFTEAYLKSNLDFEEGTNALNVDKKTRELLNAGKEVFDIIEQEQRFIKIIGEQEIIDLPVGIKQSIGGGSNITLGIISMEYHTDYTVVDMFAKVALKELNTELFFAANDVKISKDGGIYSEARLNLLADFVVPQNGGQWLLTFKGGKGKTGDGDGQTYVNINCEGKIQDFGFALDIRIAKTVAIPLNDDGTVKYPGKVDPGKGENPVNNDSYLGTSFSIQVDTMKDLLVEVDLPMFQLRSLPNWGFKAQGMVFDLSDTRNAEGIVFPELYTSQGLLQGNSNLWRGFYAKEIRVLLPPEFKKKNSTERIAVGAKDLFIDNFGVSADFYATNVFGIDEGDAGKWQMSLDSIGVDLKVNRFIKAGFSGEIVLPVSDKKSTGGRLAYTGLITAEQFYSINVEAVEDVSFDIFKAKAKLFKESYIKLEVENNRFYPEANLTGLMSFNAKQDGEFNDISSDSIAGGKDIEELEFSGLSFQDFKIQTREKPYLEIGYAGFKDSITLPKIAGFELGFYDIKIKNNENDDAELALNSYINLDKSGIRGDVRLSLIGELKEDDYLQWRYKGVEVSTVELDVKRKSFEFKGKVEFFKDNTVYGKGFAGQLELYSEHLGIQVEARGLFGAVDDYRYWFVDANGQPTKSNNENFTIYDIGGGIYHHMRKAGMNEEATSISGIYYQPDKQTELGFKALAAFEVKSGTSFAGLVGIEMSFNSESAGGGVGRVGFYGAAILMNKGQTRNILGSVSEIQKEFTAAGSDNFSDLSLDRDGILEFADKVFPKLLTGEELFAAQVGIDLDFRNRTYFGLFDVFLNAGPIKGEGENNRLGYLEFYNSPEDWYIYVGTPKKRFGLQGIPIGPVDARINLYFMTGTILPDPAAPPQNVIDILDLKGDELLFGRNFNQELARGTGYAFGAQFEIGKEFDWGIVYASVSAGVGFDLMMRDFGDAYCNGSEGPLGMDGWYSTGQLYAYLQGEIGAQIKLFGIRKRVPILKAGMAILGQAQLPNPWFIKGYAGIDVRVLGVVRIRSRLKVIIGEECEIIGKTGLQEVVMISDISPRDGLIDVDVFDAVQVAFNAPIGSEVYVEEESGSKTYRISLDEFLITTNGEPIAGEQEFNEQLDLVSFSSFEVLPPEQEIAVYVKVSFEEKIGGNWSPVTDNGTPIFEEKTIRFTTAKAPRKIPYRNIEYMYPIVDQQYMLPKENTAGYIQLDKGQQYLFGNGYSDELYFLDEAGNNTKTNFSYDATNKRLNFTIPDLANETKYTYALVTLNPGDVENEETLTTTEFKEVAEDLEISNNTIAGGATNGAFISRLDFNFTTSKYDTFKAKMRSLNIKDSFTSIDRFQDTAEGIANVGYMSLILNEYEPFGVNDIVGTVYTDNQPLIEYEALLTDDYYKKDIYPLNYKEYPLDGNIEVNRDADDLGIPPVKSMQISTTYKDFVVTNPDDSFLRRHFPYRWHLPISFYYDYKDLQYQITNRYYRDGVQPGAEKYDYLVWEKFPFLRREKYEARFTYKPPKNSSGNSSTIKYENTF